MASTSASLETSHLNVSSRGGSGRISRTLAEAVSRAGAEISAIRTAAPSRAKRMVVSRPMPLGEGNVSAIVFGFLQNEGEGVFGIILMANLVRR